MLKEEVEILNIKKKRKAGRFLPQRIVIITFDYQICFTAFKPSGLARHLPLKHKRGWLPQHKQRTSNLTSTLIIDNSLTSLSRAIGNPTWQHHWATAWMPCSEKASARMSFHGPNSVQRPETFWNETGPPGMRVSKRQSLSAKAWADLESKPGSDAAVAWEHSSLKQQLYNFFLHNLLASGTNLYNYVHTFVSCNWCNIIV